MIERSFSFDYFIFRKLNNNLRTTKLLLLYYAKLMFMIKKVFMFIINKMSIFIISEVFIFLYVIYHL